MKLLIFILLLSLCSPLLSENKLDFSGTLSTQEQIEELHQKMQDLEELNMTNTRFRWSYVDPSTSNLAITKKFFSGSFPYLKKLILDGINIINFDVSPDFADHLEILSMRNMSDLLDLKGLKNFPSLKVLDLNGRMNYSLHQNWQVRETTKDVQLFELEQLYLDSPKLSVMEYGFILNLDVSTPNLKRLSAKNAYFGMEDMVSIGNLKNLEMLDLEVNRKLWPDCPPIITEEVSQLLTSLPLLKELSLKGRKITTADFSGFLSLESLDLSETSLSKATFDTLFVLQGLKKLDLRYLKSPAIPFELAEKLCKALPECEILFSENQIEPLSLNFSGRSSNDLQEVINMPELEELDLSYVSWRGEDLIFFSAGLFPNLKKLTLNYPKGSPAFPFQTFSVFSENLESLSAKGINFEPIDLRTFESMPNLKILDLSDSRLVDENLEQMQYISLVNLEELVIDNSHTRGAFLNILAPHLKKLSLKNSNITGGDISRINEISTLKQLDLSGTKITGAAIKKLSKLVNLQELSLAHTDMNKADFSHLAPSLKSLNLSGCKMTIASFNTLFSMTHLTKLDLKGMENPNLTEVMKQQLKDTLVNCTILF